MAPRQHEVARPAALPTGYDHGHGRPLTAWRLHSLVGCVFPVVFALGLAAPTSAHGRPEGAGSPLVVLDGNKINDTRDVLAPLARLHGAVAATKSSDVKDFVAALRGWQPREVAVIGHGSLVTCGVNAFDLTSKQELRTGAPGLSATPGAVTLVWAIGCNTAGGGAQTCNVPGGPSGLPQFCGLLQTYGATSAAIHDGKPLANLIGCDPPAFPQGSGVAAWLTAAPAGPPCGPKFPALNDTEMLKCLALPGVDPDTCARATPEAARSGRWLPAVFVRTARPPPRGTPSRYLLAEVAPAPNDAIQVRLSHATAGSRSSAARALSASTSSADEVGRLARKLHARLLAHDLAAAPWPLAAWSDAIDQFFRGVQVASQTFVCKLPPPQR